MKYKSYKHASLQTQKRAIELYHDGVSANQIASQVGYSVPAVCGWFKKHGVEIKLRSVIVRCSVCGKDKTVFPRDVRGNKTGKFFCGRACFQQWNSVDAKKRFTGKCNPNYKPMTKTKCSNCGKPMSVHPSRIPESGRVYCDMECKDAHQVGAESSAWKGGVAADPYCPLWLDKRFREDIRDRDNHKCQNPDCWNNVDRLSLHHIDYDKKNCHPDNLITLCVSCNSRANTDREWHTAYYNAFMQRSGKTINSTLTK